MNRCICLLLIAIASCSSASAESRPTDEDVVITEGESRTAYEYRQSGQLRMVKIVPRSGKPYYLVPADRTRGTGDLEEKGQLVPSWRIIEF
jgi:hypothetical protein